MLAISASTRKKCDAARVSDSSAYTLLLGRLERIGAQQINDGATHPWSSLAARPRTGAVALRARATKAAVARVARVRDSSESRAPTALLLPLGGLPTSPAPPFALLRPRGRLPHVVSQGGEARGEVTVFFGSSLPSLPTSRMTINALTPPQLDSAPPAASASTRASARCRDEAATRGDGFRTHPLAVSS